MDDRHELLGVLALALNDGLVAISIAKLGVTLESVAVEAASRLHRGAHEVAQLTGGGLGQDGERDFHGEKRSNATHASTTDPDARLYRKGNGRESKLCYMGHALTENRHGLAVGGGVTIALGTAEREGQDARNLVAQGCAHLLALPLVREGSEA